MRWRNADGNAFAEYCAILVDPRPQLQVSISHVKQEVDAVKTPLS
jgi:hypothetical protein